METKKHFKKTYKILQQINVKELADWIMQQGFYPESYVLPPCFRVDNFQLQKHPISKVKQNKTNYKYNIQESKILKISFPKTKLTDRVFGVMHPNLYHDIVFCMMENWDEILKHLFDDREIFSYSFPIPITSEFTITSKRQERMIYEYIEMAEKDLLMDSVNFKYVVHLDIKNFYHSVYSHSIPWALHGMTSRIPEDYSKFGHKLDKLFHYANDKCTNGIPVGPVVSDLIAEIILASIDKAVKLPKGCFGVRYKDDYRVLCKTKYEGNAIIKELQKELDKFNLYVNETKTNILKLPNGLFRPWIIEYEQYSFKGRVIDLKEFRYVYSNVIRIDNKYSDKGTIDKFLGEIMNKNCSNINIRLVSDKDKKIFITLLWNLTRVRPKSFSSILGIIEYIYITNIKLQKYIKKIIKNNFKLYISVGNEDYFMAMWLYYFMKNNGINTGTLPIGKNDFWKVLKMGKHNMFGGLPIHKKNWSFYDKIDKKYKFGTINENVVLFKE